MDVSSTTPFDYAVTFGNHKIMEWMLLEFKNEKKLFKSIPKAIKDIVSSYWDSDIVQKDIKCCKILLKYLLTNKKKIDFDPLLINLSWIYASKHNSIELAEIILSNIDNKINKMK